MSPFARVLVKAIKDAGFNQASFAEAVGVSPAFISQVKSGIRTPPLEDISKWAKTLDIRGTERKRFIQLANLEHCPALIQDLVEDLLGQIGR